MRLGTRSSGLSIGELEPPVVRARAYGYTGIGPGAGWAALLGVLLVVGCARSLRALDNTFEVRRATVSFSGEVDPDPALDITLERAAPGGPPGGRQEGETSCFY